MSATPLSIPPAMYRCGVVIVALLSVVLGEDVQPENSSSADLSVLPTTNPAVERTSLGMSYFCFFGTLPSASCRFKCQLRNKVAYCDEEQSLCLCTNPDEVDDNSDEPPQHTDNTDDHSSMDVQPTSASTDMENDADQTETNKQHLILYIFNLRDFFGLRQEDEEVSTTEGTIPVDAESVQDQPEVVALAGWNFQHLLALLIILLLAFLVFLEIYTFYKKRNSKNYLENIFNTITVPPPSKA